MTTLDIILKNLDQAYETKAWHGPNLKGSLRGITAKEAAWQPAPGRHAIAELVLHAAYWKYAVRRRLLNEEKGSFPREGSNWLKLPRPYTDAQWQADRKLLDEMHRTLRAAVAALKPADLSIRPPGSKVSNGAILSGIAAHDFYHTGQIQYVKALLRKGEPGA